MDLARLAHNLGDGDVHDALTEGTGRKVHPSSSRFTGDNIEPTILSSTV